MQQHALDTFKRVGVAVRMGVRVVEVRSGCAGSAWEDLGGVQEVYACVCKQ